MLQPVAHALMQVAEETPEVLVGLSADQIWARPGGAASLYRGARAILSDALL